MRKNLLKFITISLLILIPIFVVNATELEDILNNIKDKLSDLGKVVCGIFIIIGGFQMLTASGDPQKFEAGKRTLLYAAIGLIIILAVDAIIDLVENITGVLTI
jgi:cobyric acid synthase